jgi:hypothetical protein
MLLLHWIETIERLLKFNAGYLPVPGNLSVCGGSRSSCGRDLPLFPHRHKYVRRIYSDALTAVYPSFSTPAGRRKSRRLSAENSTVTEENFHHYENFFSSLWKFSSVTMKIFVHHYGIFRAFLRVFLVTINV